MAEGGPVRQKSLEGDTNSSVSSLALDCPICLEQFRHPKSLPCLHSFCEECLDSYIAKELSGKITSATSFSCPVCRKVTEPMNPLEGKDCWAKQFPTNNVAAEIIKQLHSSNEPIPCEPCERKGTMNIPAEFWCKKSNTYFCETCKSNVHDLFHGNCEPENITEMNKSVLIRRKAPVIRCEKHSQKLEYYCEDHQLLGCSKCIIVDHRKCEVVTSTEDFRENLSKSSKIDDLMEELRNYVKDMNILIKDVDEKLQSMTQDQETALESLTDLRRKINERFDVLQKELTDKLILTFKKEKENLDMTKQKCERLMFAMQNTLTSSKDAALDEDAVGTIRIFQRGQAEVESCRELVQEQEKSSVSTSLRHEYDQTILASDRENGLTMGKITVHQEHKRLPPTTYTTPLSECHLKMTGKFNIKVPSDKNDCSAYGVALLFDGRVVVADSANKKVKLFTENGELQCKMTLTDNSCDICRIDGNTVAVVMVNVKTICIIKVGEKTLAVSSNVAITNISEECYGIAYLNNSFVVGTTTSLCSVKEDGNKAVQLHKIESKCLHLASDQKSGHIFASLNVFTPDKAAVTRLTDGTCTDLLQTGVIKNASGIDIDMEGNVYVCGYKSRNVLQMSWKGDNVRELLTSSDGIENPRAISIFDDKVVITFEECDQRNFVKIFKLVAKR